MVDKELNFLTKNNKYGFAEYKDGQGNIGNRLVYSDGHSLQYGDPAEIFSAVSYGKDFLDFIQSTLSGTYFSREHYWFTFGFQPADYENEEIKENEVKIHYAGVDNTISKKEFYELCLLLCEARLNGLDLQEDKIVNREDLLQIKSQLEEKIKTA